MSTSLRSRWPPLLACAFALLFVTGQLIVPPPPAITDSGPTIARYYRENADAIRWSVWLTTMASLAFVPVIARLRQSVTGLGRDVLLLGAAGVTIATLIWTWISSGLAFAPAHLDPSVATTLTTVASYYGPTLTVSVILLAAPLGWTAMRPASELPRWLVPATAVLVAEQLVETFTVFGRSGFVAPGGPMNLVLGAGLFIAWVIGAAAAASATPMPSRSIPDRK